MELFNNLHAGIVFFFVTKTLTFLSYCKLYFRVTFFYSVKLFLLAWFPYIVYLQGRKKIGTAVPAVLRKFNAYLQPTHPNQMWNLDKLTQLYLKLIRWWGGQMAHSNSKWLFDLKPSFKFYFFCCMEAYFRKWSISTIEGPWRPFIGNVSSK